MRGLWESFNSREIAGAIWLGLVLPWILYVTRSSLGALAKSFLKLSVAGLFLLLALYCYGLVQAARALNLWDNELLKDVIFWYLAVGLVSLFKVAGSDAKPELFREMVVENFRVTVVVKFIRTNYVLPLAWELVLMPVFFVLIASCTIADRDKQFKSIRKFLHVVIGLLILTVLAYAFWQLSQGLSHAMTVAMARKFLLEPALTILSIPFFFVLAILSKYETHFILVGVWLRNEPNLRRCAKWRSLIECGFNLAHLQKLRGEFFVELQDAKTKAEVLKVVERYAHMPPPKQLSGKVVGTRLEPYVLPLNGQLAQKVFIDWTNTSNSPAGAAFATIVAYDVDGEKLDSGCEDVCIFDAADRDGRKVHPGETYVEPSELGTVLLSSAFGEAGRVDVQFTRILEN